MTSSPNPQPIPESPFHSEIMPDKEKWIRKLLDEGYLAKAPSKWEGGGDRMFTRHRLKILEFCYYFLKNKCNPTSAAKEMGLHWQDTMCFEMGWEMLEDDFTHLVLNDWAEMVGKDVMMTIEEKLKKLKQVVDLCIPETATLRHHIAAREGIKAIEEMNKIQGHYADVRTAMTHKVEHEQTQKEAAALIKVLEAQHKKDF